jgi:hypothetical protein
VQWRRGVRGSPPTTAIQLARTPKKAKPSAVAMSNAAEKERVRGLPRLRHNTARPYAEDSRAQRPGRALWRRGVRGSPPDYDNPTRPHAEDGRAERSGEGGLRGLPRLRHYTARPRAEERHAQWRSRAQRSRWFHKAIPDCGSLTRPWGSICFCTSRLAARLPARIVAPDKTRRVFNTVALLYFLFLRT